MGTTFDDWTLEGIRNPNLLQSLILDKFEESTEGKYAIVDGNNVASFLIEGFSSIASKAIQKIDNTVLPAIYPSRARSATDLYKHLSDYDYLGMFASPASCSILLVVDKEYLMNNAVDVINSDGTLLYRKVVIPQTARFTIGSYTFGLYYPIEIRVSAQTGMFTVLYDTSVSNPLHILSQNILEYNFRKYDGMNLAYIKIPVYQFNTMTSIEPLVNGTGYRRTVQYTDKFYALKVTGEIRDPETDEWVTQEYQLALSGRSYNPEKPTVIFTVDPDNHQCILEIPYVYFNENRIRGNLRVDIYTTAGYLNYQIPADTEELVSLDFFGIPLDTEVQKFVDPFRTMPALGALPVTMKIIGGTNGMSYADIRRKVVTDAFGDMTLQTPADVDAYFKNEGYVTSLFKDGITDRIFNAHVVLRNNDDAIVAAGSVNTQIDMKVLTEDNTRTIIQCDENTYTILPSTRYRFDSEKGICIPLSDLELDLLNNLSAADKVAAFNSKTYTLSPFHVQVSLKDRYPTTATYDMSDADIESREFLTARDVSQHLSLNTALLTVVPVNPAEDSDRVTDKYKLQFKVIRSGLDDFDAVVTSGTMEGRKQLRVLVGLKKLDNTYTFAEATYIGRKDDTDIFEMTVSSTAAFKQLDGGHAVRIKEPFSDLGIDVYLTTEMRVILTLADTVDFIGDTYRTDVHPNRYLETDFTNATNIEDVTQIVALAEHRVNLRFGKLVNELDQRITLAYSGLKYKTYSTTELAILETPLYDTIDGSTGGTPKYHYEKENGEIGWTWADIVRAQEEGTTLDTTGMHVVLNTLYPQGTLKCYTEIKEESVTLTRFLASNYGGCWYIDPDRPDLGYQTTLPMPIGTNTAWILEGSSTSGDVSKLQSMMGRQIAIKCHTVPRFTIDQARVTLSGESPVLGIYEMGCGSDNTRGAYSHSTDKWYHAHVSTKTTTSPEGLINTYRVTDTYCVQAVDQLEYIVNNVLSSVDSAGERTINPKHTLTDGKQLADVKIFSEGMFVFVEGDTTTAEARVTIPGEEVEHPSKLYMRNNGLWVCLLSCMNFEHLVHTVETYKTQNWISGYAYLLSRIERAEYNAADSIAPYHAHTDFPAGEERVEYVAFMNTFSDGSPDFTQQQLSGDTAWQGTVNKWPWEATGWRKLNPTVIDGGFVYETDTQFVSSFDTTRMSKFCIHMSGQVKLNLNGQPETDEDSKREVQYLINMLQVDAKLAETSDAKQSLDYPSSLVTTMRTHFDNLGSVKNRLYTSTKLYFEPMKSLGMSNFYTDGDRVVEHNLDITMGFRLHVSSDIAEDAEMMESMKESIIKLIDDHMASGSTSMTTIAQLIKDNNSDSVRYVDVLGIDGDENLQTLRCVDNEVRPHLKHELRLLDDGATIDLTRGLNLEFVVADV